LNSSSKLSNETAMATILEYQLDQSKPEARFDEIVESVAETCGVAAAVLVFIGAESTVVKATYGIEIPSLAMQQSLIFSQIVAPMRTIVFNDSSQADKNQLEMLQAIGYGHVQALAGMPVLAPNGVAIGAFVLMDFAPHDFTMVQIEALARASRRVVELLESNKMAAELLAAKASSTYSDNSRQIVSELVDEILKNNGWWAARAYWVEDGELHADNWRFEPTAPYSIRRLSERVAEPVVIQDALQFPKPVLQSVADMPWLGDAEHLRLAGVRNLVVIDIAGVLSFALRLVFVVPNAHALTADVVSSLSTASILLPKVIRQERARGELHYRATHDSLTGMLNRRGLQQVVEPIEQNATGAVHAVLYLDLDHFKNVNDVHGHSVGDEVLSHVATYLIKQIRPTDVLARLGGDEFLLLALNVADLEGAKAAADRILNQVNGMFKTKSGLEIKVSASLGVALWRAGESFQNAMKFSDSLMYQAKKQGGGIVYPEDGFVGIEDPFVGLDLTENLSTMPISLVPGVAVGLIRAPKGRDFNSYHVRVEHSVRNPEPEDIAALISRAVAKISIVANTDEYLLDFPNHYWSHGGLIEEVVGELRAIGISSRLGMVLDCSLASSALRQEAVELKTRTRTEIVLKNFGSGPNELVLLDQLAPIALGLYSDAVASLGTLNPRVTSLRTTIAIASAFNLRTISFEPLTQAQSDLLAELGSIESLVSQELTRE
jgi:diguanylate cyclase (GGDEF)-like protein